MAGVLRDGESFLENHEAAEWPGKRRKCDCGDFLKDAPEPGKFLFPTCFSQITASEEMIIWKRGRFPVAIDKFSSTLRSQQRNHFPPGFPINDEVRIQGHDLRVFMDLRHSDQTGIRQ